MSGQGGALRGVRVLDLSRVLAGPLCGQMLADHGADVIKVEGPGGDETRSWGPPYVAPETSAYFNGLNRSKRNLGLDLSSPAGQEVLARLIAQSDVVVENFKVGTMERWGLGYDSVLAERHPALVYCRISGYGADGPMGGLPGYDAALQSFGGLMSINGLADSPPLRVGVPIVDMGAAQLAFSGVLLALQERHLSGLGQFIDVSLLDSVISLLHPHSAAWAATGQVPVRTGLRHPFVAPYQVFETATGPFFISAANNRQFASLMAVLGRPEMASDPRFADNDGRNANFDALEAELVRLLAGHDRELLSEQLIAAGVPASPVNDIGQALTSPQVLHRELFIDRDGYRGVGVPLKLSRSGSTAPTPPRRRGADTRSVLAEVGLSPNEIGELEQAGLAFAFEAGVESSVP